jgi:hypothetical protein
MSNSYYTDRIENAASNSPIFALHSLMGETADRGLAQRRGWENTEQQGHLVSLISGLLYFPERARDSIVGMLGVDTTLSKQSAHR